MMNKQTFDLYLSLFGEVLELNYVNDSETGKFKGYCFCVFRRQESAETILSSEISHTVKGFKLKISPAVHKDEESSFGSLKCVSPISENRFFYCASLNHEADNVRLNVAPRKERLVNRAISVLSSTHLAKEY